MSIEFTTTSITLKNLSKTFGAALAVDHINLQVDAGTLVCLLGPSGCGKTTLLRLLNRMNDLIDDARHTGSILLDAQRID